jgi:serine phosphatase RsbU (regulator of sigma subunit)/pSer/pThr/pTyr-binding forkhead associated (FHA) protein
MLKGETPGRTFPLNNEATTIGRDAACEIVLTDSQVSKRHARIIRKDGGFDIEDLQSTNGTRVGDLILTEIRRLEDGDHIEVGGIVLVFTESDEAILKTLDASSRTDPQIIQVRPEEKLHAILELAKDLGGTIDLDGVLGQVLETLFRILPQAERGFILLRGERTNDLILGASKLREASTVSPVFSRTIFNHVTNEGQAVLCEDIGADDRFGDSPSVKESQIRTMMCVPLWDRERHSIGVLQIDTRNEHGRFDEEDLELLVAVAGPVSVAIENARLHEIAIKLRDMEREAQDARAVQLALIPEKTPQVPGYQFWHYYEPARSVGGDYFDYRPLPRSGSPLDQPPERWAIAIGDVSGKGMPAALLMARLSSEVSLLVQTEPDPSRVVEVLNRNLCASRTEDHFITLLLVVLDGERHELTVLNAGHMGPMIRRSSRSIQVIGEEQAGPPLGIMEEHVCEAVTASLGIGDVVLLYTDGGNEALDKEGRLFGIERLKQTLATAPLDAGNVGQAILDAIHQHAGGRAQSDDITILCFGRT